MPQAAGGLRPPDPPPEERVKGDGEETRSKGRRWRLGKGRRPDKKKTGVELASDARPANGGLPLAGEW